MPSRFAICLSGCLLSVTFAGAGAVAQSVTTAYSFQGTGGSQPDGDQPDSIIQARDGNFYGTTAYGGGKGSCTQGTGSTATNTGCGTIFELAGGKEYVIYAFTGGATDGGVPTGLVQGPDGKLYGTTAFGGASVNDGKLCIDPNSNDYSGGTTTPAPATCCPPPAGTSDAGGCGTIFSLPVPPTAGAAETPTVLKSFHGVTSGGTEDDAYPGPMVPGILNGTPVFFGTALPCAYCGSLDGVGIDSFGSLFSFDPASDTFTSIPIPTASSFPYGYPNAVIQGLTCPSGDANCLYGTAQLSPPDFNCCGGVFAYDLDAGAQGYSDTGCTFPTQSTVSDDVRLEEGASALGKGPARLPFGTNTIVRQPGSRFPSDLEWSFTSVPMLLAQGSDGSILGTSPWACFSEGGGGLMSNYSVGPACSAPDNATVFQCQPSSDLSSWTFNTLYAFSDSGDGGGSTAGLTLAGDGNFYGSTAYGTGANNTTVNGLFQIPASALGTGVSTLPAYGTNTLGAGQAPVWMMEANDGSFYGVSPTGGDDQHGAIFHVQPITPLTAPVTVTLSPTVLVQGSAPASATLTWSVPNANSVTARQCFAFESGGSGGGAWTGAPAPNSSSGYGGTATITPTAAGNYTYALSCGGMNYGYATLQVNAALSVSTTTLTTATEEQSYSAQLQASGGIGPYTWSAAANALPAGLSLTSAGVVQGKPSVNGSFTFTVSVKDSESTPVTTTGQVMLTIDSDAPAVGLTASPSSGVVYGQTITLTATASPFPGTAAGYAWSMYDGTTALISGAASNTPNGFAMTTPALSVGQHAFQAKFISSVSGNETGVSNLVTVNVGKAPTTTSLTASSQSLNLNGSVTFTATVTSTAAGTPTGSLQFMSGTTVLGTAALSGNSLSYTTASLPAGTDNITAVYSGDSNYSGSTSNAVSVVVTGPGYSLAANPASLTVNPGGTATSTITLTPVGGYNGTTNLTCTTTARYTSCSFNPTALTADGSNTAVTSVFTFSTNVKTMSSIRNDDRPGRPAAATMLAAGSLAGLVLLFGLRRRVAHARSLRLLGLALLLFATGFVLSLTACGGGSSNSTNGGGGGNTAVTPAGNYTVTVSASAGSGSAQTLVIPVTVN